MTPACPVCIGSTDALWSRNGYHVFKCRRCGLGFVDPLPTLTELESFYNRCNYYQSVGVGYTDYGILEQGLKRMYRGFLGRVNRRYGFSIQGKRILDIGSAYGFFLDVSREAGAYELWANDITLESENKIGAKGYRFVRGPLEAAEFPSNYFDLVFLGDVFEHFRDPFEVVRQLHRILNPTGVILLTTVDFDSFFVKLMKHRWRLFIPPEHLFYWTRRSLVLLFARHNFASTCQRYTLYVAKPYLIDRFKRQFGFTPWPLKLLPVETVPVRSFDTLLCMINKAG